MVLLVNFDGTTFCTSLEVGNICAPRGSSGPTELDGIEERAAIVLLVNFDDAALLFFLSQLLLRRSPAALNPPGVDGGDMDFTF